MGVYAVVCICSGVCERRDVDAEACYAGICVCMCVYICVYMHVNSRNSYQIAYFIVLLVFACVLFGAASITKLGGKQLSILSGSKSLRYLISASLLLGLQACVICGCLYMCTENAELGIHAVMTSTLLTGTTTQLIYLNFNT